MTTNTQISPQMPANYIMPPQYVVATPEDEINVLELADQFLDKWRWWVSGTVVGGLLGLGAAFVIPPKYEARGVLRVAQVGVIEADGQGGVRPSSRAVESVSEAIVRMQTLAFREEVAERMIKAGQVSANKKDAWVRALDGKSTFKPVKDAASYVDISLTADNPAQGQAAVSTITQVLKERQQPLIAERLAQVDRSIELAKASLATMEKSYGTTQASLRAQPPNSEAYLELARMSEAGTLAGLRQKVLDLENSKLSPTTKETELVEPIGVSDRPVSPKKSVFTAGGLVLGALLGTLLGFALPAWWEFQRKRKAAKVNNAGTVA